MQPATELLLSALRAPESVAKFSEEELDVLLRVARAASLEARLSELLSALRGLDTLPERARHHLDSAKIIASRQHEMAQWEVKEIQQALCSVGIPVVLLKGAAYLVADLPPARGRTFSDIDILVPKARLADAEQYLFAHGWISQGHDAYDQRYYRQWMHELPPLTHITRKSLLDVHHTILPPTAKLKPDPNLLLEGAQPIDGLEGVFVPQDVDLILHSATHLFHEGELQRGLRDLADIHALLQHFRHKTDFWERLLKRAIEMDLALPLFYGLRYCRLFLRTHVPPEVDKHLSETAPSGIQMSLMDALFTRALAPSHWLCDDAFTASARWALYVRAHYLRMPPHLLIPHLFRKALKKRFPAKIAQNPLDADP